MAKKIVRGITDVKTINNQDYDTNNVNDLLSDGHYNYIHRKKGKNEEYHNLTDNIKTISSDNTELLSVTNNNKTTNTATLHPKHDAQKEQVLESTRDTITINHGTNATAEKTTVDTNPLKVLEHENLISDSEYITLDHQTDVNKTHIKTESLKQELGALYGELEELYETISAIGGGGGETSTIDTFNFAGGNIRVTKHIVQSGGQALITFTFNCNPQATTEAVIPDLYKETLEPFFQQGKSISNGALTITNDGTTIKLINSGGSQNVSQQGTFTFYYRDTGGGEPGGGGEGGGLNPK